MLPRDLAKVTGSSVATGSCEGWVGEDGGENVGNTNWLLKRGGGSKYYSQQLMLSGNSFK